VKIVDGRILPDVPNDRWARGCWTLGAAQVNC
jgi:hypothetical protein